jgi:phenylacetate-CoA ligase
MFSAIKSHLKFYARHNFMLNKKIEKIHTYYDQPSFELLKNEAFLKMLNQVYKSNTFYKQLYNDHGVDINSIKSIDDSKNLPIIKKSDVRENTEQIKQKTGLLINTGYTSGTTGSPLVVYRDYDSILNEHAYLWWYRINSGLNPKDRKISIRGDLNRDTLHYLDKASNTLFISSFVLNDSNIKKIIPVIRKFRPKAVLGYPSSLYTIAIWLEENNEELNIPLSFTSSESLLSFQEQLINKTFHTKLFDWYGNAERTIALYREDTKYFEPLLYGINQYQKDKVITTSLINNYFPLIRYEVNDVLNQSGKNNLEKKSITIESIDGRIEDYVYLPDGTKIGRLDVVFKALNNISMAQIIQKNISSIDVKIVPLDQLTKNDIQTLRQNLIFKLGRDIQINIKKITKEEIEYSFSGKFKLVISKIDNK